MKLQLVSFKLCPYVQRSVITLKHKNAPFDITYIELDDPPGWFNEISPLGQVPLLIVDDKTTLFESSVINEFVDEVIGKRLLPADPLQRARERAWISFGGELLGAMYGLTLEKDPQEMAKLKAEFFQDMKRLEDVIAPEGPFFQGKELGLADTSYAPLFKRVFLSAKLDEDGAWKSMPRVRRWAEALLALPAVKASVVPEFDDLHRSYCRELGSLLY